MRGWGEVVGVRVRSPEHRVLQGRAWAQPLPCAAEKSHGAEAPPAPRGQVERPGAQFPIKATRVPAAIRRREQNLRDQAETRAGWERRRQKRVLGFQDVWLLLLHTQT